MIRTISMQVNPHRKPHTMPTVRRPFWSAPRTVALFVATVLCALLAGAILTGHSSESRGSQLSASSLRAANAAAAASVGGQR